MSAAQGGIDEKMKFHIIDSFSVYRTTARDIGDDCDDSPCISGVLRNVKGEGVRLDPSRARWPVRGTHATVQGPGQPQPHLAGGKELHVSVADRMASGRYLVNVRGSLLATTASGGLNVGDSLFVRVEQLQPQVILRMLN